MIADRRTNVELTDFLRSRRATLRRSDFGLPSNRPGATLSQEDVAELAGVSRQWYLAFETGRLERPTLDLLDRIARALALEPAAAETLFRLAIRDVLPLPQRPRLDPEAAVLDALSPIRDFARRSSCASDVAELAALGSEAVARAIGAAFAYCAVIDDGFVATFVAATGAGRAIVGSRDYANHPLAVELAAGRTAMCEDVVRSGVPALQAYHRLTGSRSFLSTTLVRGGTPVALVGVSFDEARRFSPAEIASIETVRAIAELALAGV